MSNSQRSSAKFWLFASLVVILSSAGLSALWPYVVIQAHASSKALTAQGQQASGGEAQSDYQLAVWLNSGNQAARLNLAQADLNSYQSWQALETLSGVGEGTIQLRLRTQSLIETRQYGLAATSGYQLVKPVTASQDDILLALLADSLAQVKAPTAALTSRLSSPGALQDAARIQTGKLPLASVLYARGLLNSSSAILTSLPESFERDLLLARINYTRGTPSDLSSAVKNLQLAIRDDPAALAPHQLLETIYRDQNQFTQSGAQQALVTKLQTGRP